ncbi:response regulator transcription factor [Streptomyces sp. NPDC059582]|uniref:response regulator transcription factor n=1 Tax=Streptomyces sp. NPDC059582 TaxID=3346875 RepID=UPI0036962CA9
MPCGDLTSRERETLDRVAPGHSYSKVATDLGLASKTIANRMSTIFTKLGVADRTAASSSPAGRAWRDVLP